ncbi:lactobacillus shifted protein [Achaetomium macrosporum]|uniref:Lactobacillus shifted protein n=1 Tax=Achaetomium macrosporum TaxID=79813 RepID=A0AAN7C681_9PEZI|nr:lactobacillus shifted protein [Achaetomium macrosporum]
MYASRMRVAAVARGLPRHLSKRQAAAFSTTARQLTEAPAASKTPADSTVSPATPSSTTTTTTANTQTVPQETQGPEPTAVAQAPNRAEIWSRSQRPRSVAMTGPRFEQTDFELQPRPYAAIELIHQQPVRWTHDRIVACDGGGGPTGHPKIYINTDKPEIATCGYCGLPFANEHHRKHLESLPETSYPLSG